MAARRLACMAAACGLLAACGGGGGAGTAPQPPGGVPDVPLACIDLPDDVTWFRSSSASAEWNDVLVDSRNRIWLAGYVDGIVGQATLDPSGNARAVVRQLAPDGQLLWDSGPLLDTAGTDSAEALALSSSGAVYVVGRTTGAFAGGTNAGQFDTFVAWADDGRTQWRTVLAGNERPQHPRRAALATDGSLRIAGFDDDYIPSNYVAAWSDPFAMSLRRLDGPSPTLTTQWSHQFNTPEGDQVEGLAVGSDGASYVSGIVGSGAQRGAFVRKLDGNGTVLWTVRYTSQPTDEVRAIKPLADGTMLIAGSVYGSFRGAAGFGGQDVFVARIDAGDGHVIASWQYGSPGADWLADMTVDSQGRILLFGETEGSVVPGQPAAGLTDLFMLRLSADGTVLGRRQWGTADDERAQRVAADSCGRVVAVGSSTHAGVRAGLLWQWKP
ncbi:hypothetical protein LXT13_22035 [Pelomonas sp. P8]|uniref:Lipoprotein n=2 Tax=Pelomonas cellulosilytica TaxID=2906762 RepID=A0ABS8Y263_9BURK|nr:hypothetical protein [Pelomonas sp. P8]